MFGAVKVLHVTSGYYPESPGGIESYLEMTMAAQQAAGLEVCLLAGSPELGLECGVAEDEYHGVRVMRLRREDWFHDHYALSYHAGASQLIREVFTHEEPDVVHVHQWLRLSSDIVGIARALGIPTVVTLHDVYTSCPRAFRVHRDGQPCFRSLSIESCRECVPRFGGEPPAELDEGIVLFREQYRAELQMADRVLVAMRVTAELLSDTTSLPLERYELHNLPYQSRFAGMSTPESPGGVVRFGYWGSLTSHKGPHILLEAMRQLVSETSVSVELHLFGPAAPEAFAEKLRVSAGDLPVTFHGPFDAAALAAADLDVGVFPVLCFEAFGLGLAECFDLGLPAIVSDIGALAERVGDAGLRVPPGDAGALATAMRELAEDAGRRAALASKLPAPPPTPAAHVEELSRIYEAVQGEERQPSITIPPERRARFLAMQRESLAAALRDSGGPRGPV